MHLERIDARDPQQFDEWFDTFSASENSRPGRTGPGWQPDEWRARSHDDTAPVVWHLLVDSETRPHPRVVAAAEVTRDDNLEWLRCELHVAPMFRRHGLATAALAQLEDYARGLQRREIVVSAIEGSTEFGSAPNRFFAPKCGYRVADEYVRRDLAWPRPDGELDARFAAWSPYADDYDIMSYVGVTPDTWHQERARLFSVMPVEAPHSDLDVTEELWDENRVAGHERTVNEMGRDLFVALAREETTNSLVGFSELTVSRESPDTAYQWETLVVGTHRGHRLGGLMKVATMRLLSASQHATQRISTFNSVLNGPMIAVNDALGAQVAGGQIMWKKEL